MSVDIDTAPDKLADAFAGEVVMTTDDEQRTWAGTVYWIVKQPLRVSPPNSVSRLVAAARTVRLTERRIGAHEVMVGFGDRLGRVYDRPDGEAVVINHAYISAVESMLVEEDDYGTLVPIPTKLMQGDSPRSPIGVHAEADDELLAFVMPVVTS